MYQKSLRDVKFVDFAVRLLSAKFYSSKRSSGLSKRCIQLDDQEIKPLKFFQTCLPQSISPSKMSVYTVHISCNCLLRTIIIIIRMSSTQNYFILHTVNDESLEKPKFGEFGEL